MQTLYGNPHRIHRYISSSSSFSSVLLPLPSLILPNTLLHGPASSPVTYRSYSILRQSICTPNILTRAPKRNNNKEKGGGDSSSSPSSSSSKTTTGGGGKGGGKHKEKENGSNVTETNNDDPTIDEEGLPEGKDLKSMLSRHIEYCRRELAKVRGATANPAMLDHITLEVYGENQVLTAVAQIMLKGPQLLTVNPFDPAIASDIANAIRDADLGLNPNVDGNIVKVPVPKSSKESREANVKLISKIAEGAKTRIRRARQAALEKAKKVEGISEDDIRRDTKIIEEQIQTATAEVAKLAEKKKLEVEAN